MSTQNAPTGGSATLPARSARSSTRPASGSPELSGSPPLSGPQASSGPQAPSGPHDGGPGPLREMWAMLAAALRDRRSAATRDRIPEPMVIDDPAAVLRFGEGGDTQPAMRSVYDFNARALSALIPAGGHLLDLGVASGQAIAYLMHRRPDITVTGVDLSAAMLADAGDMLARQGLIGRVNLVEADITDLPSAVTAERVDAVSCLWTLHQLPDTALLAAALRQIAALRDQHGAAVWLLDFQRLRSPRSFPGLLSATEPGYPGPLRDDAIDSEAAAFRTTEVRRELENAGLGELRSRASWPLPLLQAHWAPAGHQLRTGAKCWTEIPVDRRTRRKAALLRRGFGTSLAAPLPAGSSARPR